MNGQAGLPGLPGAKVSSDTIMINPFQAHLWSYSRVNEVKLQSPPSLDHRAVQVPRVSLVNEEFLAYLAYVCERWLAIQFLMFPFPIIILGGFPGPKGFSGNPGKFSLWSLVE